MNNKYIESHKVLKVSFQQLQHVAFIAKAEKCLSSKLFIGIFMLMFIDQHVF